MADYTSGNAPEHITPQFLPEADLNSGMSIPAPSAIPDFSAQTAAPPPSNDFIHDIFSKPHTTAEKFAVDSAPVKFSAEDTGLDMYKGAEQFKAIGINLDGNNEENYGQLQTGWDRTKRALGGIWALTKNQFVDQATSWGDSFSFLKDNKSAFEKSDMEEINKKQKELQDQYHIFHTAKDDATLFNWANLAETIQQSGYALGAMAEVTAEEFAMSALTAVTFGAAAPLEVVRTAANATSIAKMLKRVTELGNVTNDIGRARKVFNTINAVNPFLDNSLRFALDYKSIRTASEVAGESMAGLRTLGKGFGAFYRDVREVNAALSEAKSEAAGTHQQLTKQLTDKFQKENGVPPTGQDLEQINTLAMKAAQTDGIWNTYLIMTTNKIGMKNIMEGFKPLRDLGEVAVKDIIELSDKAALRKGKGLVMEKLVDATSNKWMAFRQNIVRTPLVYLKGNLDEALQENLQDVIKDGTISYYQSKYDNNNGGKDPMKSLYTHMIEQSSNQFTMGGAKTFLSGFFTGAIMRPGNYIAGQMQEITPFMFNKSALAAGDYKGFAFNKEGYKARNAATTEARTTLIREFNDIYNNPLTFGAKLGNANMQANFGEILKAAVNSNDKKAFNDIQDDATRHIIMTGIKSGALESLIERYKDLPAKLSKEEFTTAFGMDNTKENIESLTHQLNHFADRAAQVADIHERMSDKYKNPFNIYHERFQNVDKATDPEYIRESIGSMAWGEAVDNLVYMKDYYNQNIRRSTTMLTGLAKKPGFENVAFDNVTLLTSADHIAVETAMLSEEIKGLKDATDAASKKLYAQKVARLELLDIYHGHLTKWQEKFDEHSALVPGDKRTAAFAKSFAKFTEKATPVFADILNGSLKEAGKPQITTDQVQAGFVNIHDYMKAQKEAGIVLDKINLLADPAHFRTFFSAHNLESRYWHAKSVEENERDLMQVQKRAAIEAERTRELENLKKGVSEDHRTGTNEEKENQINADYDAQIKAHDALYNGGIDPKTAEAAKEQEEARLRTELAEKKTEEQVLDAAKKAEEAAKNEVRTALEKIEKAAALAKEAEQKHFEAEQKKQKDAAEVLKDKQAHDAKLAEIERVKTEAAAVQQEILKKAEAALEKTVAAQKAAESARQAAVLAVQAKADADAQKIKDALQVAKAEGDRQAALELARQEADEKNRVLQAALAKIPTATGDELADIKLEMLNHPEILKNESFVEAFLQRLAALKEEGKDTPLPTLDEAANYDKVEKETKILDKDDDTGVKGRKTDTAFATTEKEQLDDNKTIDTDPAKRRFFSTLDVLRTLLTGKGALNYNEVILVPGRKGIMLRAMNPTKLFTESQGGMNKLNDLARRALKQSTIAKYDSLTQAADGTVKSPMSEYMQSAIMVITDEAGEPYLFNDKGQYDPQGVPVTTNMRKPQLVDGQYILLNTFGTQLQTPQEIVANLLKRGGLTIDGKTLIDPKLLITMATEAQQEELKRIFDIRKDLENNLDVQYIYPITTITDGVVHYNHQSPSKISAFKMDHFDPRVVTTTSGGQLAGGVYFRLPGYSKEILMVRPKLTEEQAETIIHLLTDKLDTVSPDKILSFLKSMVFTKHKDIFFGEKDGILFLEDVDGKSQVDLSISELREAFKRKLLTRKMNITKEDIGSKVFTHIDYKDEKFAIDEISYNDFLKDNFETYIQPKDGAATPLNAYIKYNPLRPMADSNLSAENQEVLKTIRTAEEIKVNEQIQQFEQLIQVNEKQIAELTEFIKNAGEDDLAEEKAERTALETQNKRYETQIKDANNKTIKVQEVAPQSEKITPITTQQHDEFMEGLNKATGITNTATPAQTKAAEEWWPTSPLSKHIGLKELFNVVNSNAIATWTQQGITLFNGANFTDTYHEAFHGFSQLYLTKEQKTNLYNEVRKIHPEMNDLQAEELLAEDFRKYVLSGSKLVLDQRPMRNTIWRKIFNFLRELFTGVSQADYAIKNEAINKIQALYDKLYTGKLNEYSPSVNNIQFGKLNKGIEGKDGVPLSNSESILIKDTIDSMIVSTMGRINDSLASKGKPQKNILSLTQSAAFQDAMYANIQSQFQTKLEQGNDYQKVLSKFVLDNFDSTKKYHYAKSDYLKAAGAIAQFDEEGNIKMKAEEGDDASGTERKDSGFDRKGNDLSVKENADPEIIQLVSSLFARGKDAKKIINALGEPTLAKFAPTHQRVIKNLMGILDEKQMYQSLLRAVEEYPELADLARQLGNPDDYEENSLKFDLWMKMRQTYSLSRIPINQLFISIDDKGNLLTRVVESKPAIDAIKRQFTSDFQSNLDREYIYVDEKTGNNVLNVKKVLDTFTTTTTDQKGETVISINKGQEKEFLKTIGFNLSDKPEVAEAISKIAQDTAKGKLNYLAQKLFTIDQAAQIVTDPMTQLSDSTEIKSEGKKTVFLSKGETANVTSILEIEARNSDDYSNYSIVNASGDKVYELSQNNQITVMNRLINDAATYETYQDVIQVPELYKFDIARNPLIKGSKLLESMFDMKTGQRNLNEDGSFVTVNLANMNGAKEIKGMGSADTGLASNQLDMNGKHLFDVNTLLLSGLEELPRVADKSTYYALSASKVPGATGNKLYFPISNFTRKEVMDRSITAYMNQALVGELTRTGWMNEGVLLIQKEKAGTELTTAEQKMILDSGATIEGYNKRALKLTTFDGILKATTQARLLKLVERSTPADLEETIKDMESELHAEYKHYFDALADENWNKKKDGFHISHELMDKLTVYLKTKSLGKDNTSLTDKQRMLNRAHAVNSFVNKLEAVRWIYGDPAFYNLEKQEFNKRISAFGATKTTISVSQSSMNYVNSKGRLVAKAMGLEQKQFDGTMGVRIYGDIKIQSENITHLQKVFMEKFKDQALVDKILDPFMKDSKGVGNMKESDAQGYITLDAYRMLKMLQGDWTKPMEAIYLKEVNGDPLTQDETEQFFSVMKGQYAGPLATDKLYVPVFHKYSLMPLIPSLIKGTNMEAVNRDMIESEHDYATFESGTKIATLGTPQPFYKDNDTIARVPNLSSKETIFTTNTIFARHWGEQLRIEAKWKKEAVFSTQMRTKILEGMYENARPLDYKESLENWNKLSEAQKLKASPFHRMAETFNGMVAQKSALLKEQLIKDARIEEKDGRYTISDFGPIVRMIKAEFEKKDLPDDMIDFIDLNTDRQIKTPLDLSTQSQKIEGVIQAIVNNRLIRQKVNGEPLIQLANSGFEKFRTATLAEKALYTNDLPFYQKDGRIVDGKPVTSAMKVKIALSGDYLNLFNLMHSDGKKIGTGDIESSRIRLNEMLKDEKWLDGNNGENRKVITLTGTRIPVQGMNSMEFMEVYEFLPSRAGSVLIPASEIVAKSGSDFDVDKLTVFKAHIDENGAFIKSSHLSYAAIDKLIRTAKRMEEGLEKEAKLAKFRLERKNIMKGTENRMNDAVRAILEHDHNFFDLVTPNTTADVEPLADKLAARNIGYNASFNKVTGVHETFTKNGTTIPYVSPTRLIESGFNDAYYVANNSGKEGLGIGAIDNKFNTMFNTIGAYLNQFYIAPGGKKQVNVYLDHNRTTINGISHVSMSHLYDTQGNLKIADIISQLMNGWVDVGKKPWIFNINGGVEGAPVILFLNQAGTPIADIANFMTQPILQQYTEALRSKNNIFERVVNPEDYTYFESQKRMELLAPLLGIATTTTPDFMRDNGQNRLPRYADIAAHMSTIQLMEKNKEVFSSKSLESVITDKLQQAALLYQYFQLEDIAKGLKDIKTSSNFDTNKAENSIATQDKLDQFQRVLATELLPPAQLLALHSKTVLKSFAIQQFNLDFQEQLLPLRNSRLMNDYILHKKKDLPIDSRAVNFDAFARTFKNDFIEYLFQNNVTSKNGFNTSSWFTGARTMSDRLFSIKVQYPQLVAEYPLLSRLVKDRSKNDKGERTMNSIKLVDATLDTDAINIYQEQFAKLVDPSVEKLSDPKRNEELSTFFTHLAMFGFLQSGMNKSNISWTEIIPQKLYTNLMAESVHDMTANLTKEKLDTFYQKFQEQNTQKFKFKEYNGQEMVAMPVVNNEPHRYKEYRDKIPAAATTVTSVKATQLKTNAPQEISTPSTFNDLNEFTEQEKASKLANFGSKHRYTAEESLNYINAALATNPQEVIAKLKECY